jgi:hypothetical protein
MAEGSRPGGHDHLQQLELERGLSRRFLSDAPVKNTKTESLFKKATRGTEYLGRWPSDLLSFWQYRQVFDGDSRCGQLSDTMPLYCPDAWGLVDYLTGFGASGDLELYAAGISGIDVDAEYALQLLHPRHIAIRQWQERPSRTLCWPSRPLPAWPKLPAHDALCWGQTHRRIESGRP